MDKDYLTLKRASASRPSGEWDDDDFDVLADGVVVGRIFNSNAGPVGSPWMWTLAFDHHEDRTPTHGYTANDAPQEIKSMPRCVGIRLLAERHRYPLTDLPQFGILGFGPGWRGSDAIRSTEAMRVHRPARGERATGGDAGGWVS
jgi:hypothetical protein